MEKAVRGELCVVWVSIYYGILEEATVSKVDLQGLHAPTIFEDSILFKSGPPRKLDEVFTYSTDTWCKSYKGYTTRGEVGVASLIYASLNLYNKSIYKTYNRCMTSMEQSHKTNIKLHGGIDGIVIQK